MPDHIALDVVGFIEGTTKSSLWIDFLRHYDRHLTEFRDQEIQILEIGVLDGASLALWKQYFTKATIIGVDIDARCKRFEEGRAVVEIGSQDDPEFLATLSRKYSPTIIVDDGSHLAHHVIFSFEHLFPFLKAGGIYVIEDMFLHTGSSEDAHLGHADMSPPKYLFELSRMLMWQGVDPAKNFGSWASFRRQIDEIAFVPNGAAFIRKKQEDDPTSLTAQAEAYAQQKGTALGWSRAADYIQRKGGSLARAEAAAATAIKLEPASSPAYLSLSQIQIARSDFDGATRSALHAAELAPGHAAAWQHLAQIYSRQNDFAQAETAFRKAIRANDKQFASYDGLGRVLARQQKTAEARDVLNAGLAANPPSGWQDILKRSLAEVPGI